MAKFLEVFEKEGYARLGGRSWHTLGNRYPDIPGKTHLGQSLIRIQVTLSIHLVYCMCTLLPCIPVLMGR